MYIYDIYIYIYIWYVYMIWYIYIPYIYIIYIYIHMIHIYIYTVLLCMSLYIYTYNIIIYGLYMGFEPSTNSDAHPATAHRACVGVNDTKASTDLACDVASRRHFYPWKRGSGSKLPKTIQNTDLCYWKWPFIVDLPTKNCDFLQLREFLPQIFL